MNKGCHLCVCLVVSYGFFVKSQSDIGQIITFNCNTQLFSGNLETFSENNKDRIIVSLNRPGWSKIFLFRAKNSFPIAPKGQEAPPKIFSLCLTMRIKNYKLQ